VGAGVPDAAGGGADGVFHWAAAPPVTEPAAGVAAVGLPHLVQNFVSGERPAPHFVQKAAMTVSLGCFISSGSGNSGAWIVIPVGPLYKGLVVNVRKKCRVGGWKCFWERELWGDGVDGACARLAGKSQQ